MDPNYTKQFSDRSMRCISGIVMKTPTILYKAYASPVIWTCQTLWRKVGGASFIFLSMAFFVKGEKSGKIKEKFFYYFASVFCMFAYWAKEVRNLILAIRHR